MSAASHRTTLFVKHKQSNPFKDFFRFRSWASARARGREGANREGGLRTKQVGPHSRSAVTPGKSSTAYKVSYQSRLLSRIATRKFYFAYLPKLQ